MGQATAYIKDRITNQTRCEVKFDERPITNSSVKFFFENETAKFIYENSDLFQEPYNKGILKLNFVPKINLNNDYGTSLANNFIDSDELFQEVIIHLESENFDKNLKMIQNRFAVEFDKYSHYITTDKSDAKKQIELISNELAKINFENILVELSPLNSVKFKVKLDSEKMLIITRPFVEISEMDNDDVIFSYFINRECIISDAIKLTKLVEGFSKYLSE